MRKSMYGSCSVVQSITQTAKTNGTVNGTTVDRNASNRGFRSAMLSVQTGTLTDGSHSISLEDSDDGSAWAAVPADQVQGTNPMVLAVSDDNVVKEMGYLGGKRYIRPVAVTTGATTGGVFGAVMVLGDPRRGTWR